MRSRGDFFSWVNKNGENGCWIWEGAKNNDGYGYYYLGKDCLGEYKIVRAHRWSYEHHKGPIPQGLHIDHLCRNRSCVNPDHLEVVTGKENVLRGVGPTAMNAQKIHCANGHPFDEENTRIDKNNIRRCKTCEREKALRYYYRQKQKKE
jgi:hypothetical protein